MHSLESALAIIKERISPVETELVSIYQAPGRVLRQRVVADQDLPPFDRSSVDGYAISRGDSSSSFQIIATIRAGEPAVGSIAQGECARIFTGAGIPVGADMVVMQELAIVEGSIVRFQTRPPFSNILKRGEDAQQGHCLVSPSTLLRPSVIGTLAMLGLGMPEVSRKVRVAHLATGDELVEVEQVPTGTQIRDSNSSMLRALLGSPRCEVVTQKRVSDDLDALHLEAATALEAGCDVLLISGGASVGDHDHAASVLDRLGFTVHFRQLNLRPGKPRIFASRGRQLAFGIPGNPVSHLVCFELLIRFALEQLAGLAWQPTWMKGRLSQPFEYTPHPRETFWPAKWEIADGITIRQLPWHSSGHLPGLVAANALLRLPSQSGPFRQGDLLEFFRLD